MKKNLKILLAIAWSIIIFVVLVMPLPASAEKSLPGADKAVHAILFGVLSYLLILIFSDNEGRNIRKTFIFGLLISSAYAAFLEYVQLFVPSRHESGYDFLASLAGIIIAEILTYAWNRKKFA